MKLFKLPTPYKKKKQKETEEAQLKAESLGEDKKPSEKLAEGMVNIRDIIAPSAIEVDFNHVKIGNIYYRTVFVSGYPRFVGANWLSPIINFEHTLTLSMFYYPVKSKGILEDLRKKITEMEATMKTNLERGKLVDPGVDAALKDAKALQEQLVKGIEKFFQFSFYITIPAESLEELDNVTRKLESTLGSLLLISKAATLQMEEAFQSTVPTASDKLLITRNMDTTSLATTFPFTSSDLTSEDGIMYGINMHNGSLVVFDRFSMENANSVIFAKSGAGKSYFVKLEALRLMVFGAEVLIIDPEEEYRALSEAVGGNYISFSASSPHKINPFDLSGIAVEGENELGQKLLSLHTLLTLMLGELTPTEQAVLDRSLIETYRIKGITTDPDTQRGIEPPIMEDLYKVLRGAIEPEAKGMADRLEKYIRGSMTGIFDSQSNVDLNSKMTVFSTKNLEDTIRPIAFYLILDFVWTRIRKNLKKRVLIVEEAWYLLQNEDSARFIYGIAKRARKYYLGLTTITQDVDDFLTSEYGKVIVTNSSIQVLLKQHPAAIESVANAFYLSEGEKRLLLSAGVGEGLFFAGRNHVSIRIKASEAEHNLITTNPEELLRMRNKLPGKNEDSQRPVYRPVASYETEKSDTQTQEVEPYSAGTMQTPPPPQEQQQRGQLEVGQKSIPPTPETQSSQPTQPLQRQQPHENVEIEVPAEYRAENNVPIPPIPASTVKTEDESSDAGKNSPATPSIAIPKPPQETQEASQQQPMQPQEEVAGNSSVGNSVQYGPLTTNNTKDNANSQATSQTPLSARPVGNMIPLQNEDQNQDQPVQLPNLNQVSFRNNPDANQGNTPNTSQNQNQHEGNIESIQNDSEGIINIGP